MVVVLFGIVAVIIDVVVCAVVCLPRCDGVDMDQPLRHWGRIFCDCSELPSELRFIGRPLGCFVAQNGT